MLCRQGQSLAKQAEQLRLSAQLMELHPEQRSPTCCVTFPINFHNHYSCRDTAVQMAGKKAKMAGKKAKTWSFCFTFDNSNNQTLQWFLFTKPLEVSYGK